jgi:hypothetical protein
MTRRYEYVGPPEVRRSADAAGGPGGTRVRSTADLDRWTASNDDGDAGPFTYVVDADGTLLLAPRRSEHVACAGGSAVLAAGEITFARDDDGWLVSEVSNQSTGYCPDVTSWPAVAAALDRAGLRRPDRFTVAFVFRRCPSCGGTNIVKDGDYTCDVCEADLPLQWNFDRR